MQVELFLFVVSTVVALALIVHLVRVERKLSILFRGKYAKQIEALVYEHASHITTLNKDQELLKKAVEGLEATVRTSVQKVGVVRFNPFSSERGGDQSFAIALLNGHDDGVVISSLYIHGNPMTYAKPIEKGASRYNLSDEEKEALAKARDYGQPVS